MSIYLYVKTHRKTGLKYLGQTKAKDPFTYAGSGIRWINHLRCHGYHYDTEILRECQETAEVKEWGIYYSKLWNVVESDEWANLKDETGDGGAYPNSGQHMKLPIHKARMSGDNNHMRSKENRERMRLDNPMSNQEARDKISAKLLGKPKSENHKRNIVNPMSDPNISARRKGKNNPLYNHTSYTFEHKEQRIRVSMTQDDMVKTFGLRRSSVSNLLRNRIKSTMGWILVNLE